MPDVERSPSRPQDAAAPEATDAQSASPASDAPPVNWSSWGRLWQIPTIIGSVALIALGVHMAISKAPGDDFEGALTQVERYLVEDRIEEAGIRLRELVEPNLAMATPPQMARYHVAVGDWLSEISQEGDVDHLQADRRISEQYAKAMSLGAAFDPPRLERWAEALITIGDLTGAKARLNELEHLISAGQDKEGALQARNLVLRRLLERGLAQPNLSYEDVMQLLSQYRDDRLLKPTDEAWAIARQAELRLETGLTEQAIDRLLIDMRRLEARMAESGAAPTGELYVLLGRGYFHQGRSEDARYALQQALRLIDGPDPVRGAALVLLGQLSMADSRYDEAFEAFDTVVRDFISTTSFLPGLVGRGEVRGVMGDHVHSLEDFREVRELLSSSPPRRDVTAERVGHLLEDRHDAALAALHLEVAQQYAMLAEELFDRSQVPPGILLRIGATSRRIADAIVAEAIRVSDDPSIMPHKLDAGVRAEANTQYKRAADYYIRHARALAGTTNEDQAWSDSLWMAADSYDLAGWHDLAIEHFREYLAGRSAVDPRRAEAMFRLAQAFHAGFDHDAASKYYEQVIQEMPRSPYAAKSHVPLAQCYLATSRRALAQQQLMGVLSGEQYIAPEAHDYREALLELGRMYYEAGEYVPAIERLQAAVDRYPEDPRRPEILYRLAASHRGLAQKLQEEASSASIARAHRDQLSQQRDDSLREAMTLYTKVIELYERQVARGVVHLERLQQDYLRYAYLYRADCAYDLGQFEEAVELFDQAARKYASHHASMSALVQIVNCYQELGDQPRAKAAHSRALLRLQQLPPETFDTADSPLDRGAWETWLRNVPLQQLPVRAVTQEHQTH